MLSCTVSAAAVHRALLTIPPSCQHAHEWKPLKFKGSKTRLHLCAVTATSSASVEVFQSTPKPKTKPTLPTLPQEAEESNGSNSHHVCEKIIRLCRAERFQEALDIFRIVQHRGVDLDVYTYAYLLKGCTIMKNIEEGRQVHAHLLQSGVVPDHFLAAKLVIMYAKFGMLLDARQMFDKMRQRKLEAWNSLIAGYAQNGQGYEALELFCRMLREGLVLDKYTFTTVVRVCAGLAAIDTGQQIHACIVKRGFQKHVFVERAMVDMYAKCGRIDDARQVFDKMSERNVISWNAMIAGYVQHGFGDEALRLFYGMQLEGIKVDHFTLATIVRVCVCTASVQQAKEVHGGIVRSGYGLDVVLGSALVDLYSKWGAVEDARQVLDKMPKRNLISWNTMIAGYANHGQGREAIKLFERMRQECMRPNHVTFLAVLSACSYLGLVDEGWHYFNCMEREYGKFPRAMHYARMVDLLGRTGQLNEAYDLIVEAPLTPTVNMWGALLSACRMHGNTELGIFAAECLVELEPAQIGNYVVLFNIYAGAGRAKDAEKVKQIMEDNGMKEEPVCSWIEINKRVHIFSVGDRSHPQTEDIYVKLEELTCQMKEEGYVPNSNMVFPDVPEQAQGNVSYHSEKLATAFGLISTHPTTSFQIVQKHRICADCHTAIKLISNIVGQEIVVRDAKCFHYFSNGMCSCGDYW